MFQTAAAGAFFAAWQALRTDGALPHSHALFQGLPSSLVPRLVILEQAPGDRYVVRFMGTARVDIWGEEVTGRDSLELMSPALAGIARRNLATVLDHPCGLHQIGRYITPAGREAQTEHITLPVGTDPGLPRRLMNFSEEISTIAYGAPGGEIQAALRREWLDIGSGLPAKPPAR